VNWCATDTFQTLEGQILINWWIYQNTLGSSIYNMLAFQYYLELMKIVFFLSNTGIINPCISKRLKS
jgi:hypothetical protein